MFRTVVVRAHGSFVGKRGERLVVRGPSVAKAQTKPTEEQIPFFRVGEILLPAHGVSLSTDLIEEAVARGIRLPFLERVVSRTPC